MRDYVHVCDLADAHLASLARLEAGGPSGFYNLGSGNGMSVKQVVESVARVSGRSSPHAIGPRRPGDPARLVASNAAARRDLGWGPKMADLDTIVRTAWRWPERMPNGYAH